MKVTKLADKMTGADLAEYLRQHAGEYKITPAKAPLTRGFTRLLKAFDNNRFLLACVTDWLLQHGSWPTSDQGIDERLTSIGVYDYAVRQMGGSNQEWKYLYYQRFCENRAEQWYFVFWLGVLSDCFASRPGTRPANVDLSWTEYSNLAKKKLNSAVSSIQIRMETRGSLEEWPNLSDSSDAQRELKAQFIHHPERARLLPRNNAN